MTISSTFGNLGSDNGFKDTKTPNFPNICLTFSKSQFEFSDRYLVRSDQFPDCGKEIVL